MVFHQFIRYAIISKLDWSGRNEENKFIPYYKYGFLVNSLFVIYKWECYEFI